MTPDFRISTHIWGGMLKSLAVGICVFYLGRESAVRLTVHHVHGFLPFFYNVVAGIAAGLLVLLYERGRQRALEKLQESEQRFRLVADTAPVLIWMSGTDKLCTTSTSLGWTLPGNHGLPAWKRLGGRCPPGRFAAVSRHVHTVL